jgi:cbb3-type cytochrome oxidase maturation protein
MGLEILYLLIPASIALALVALTLFVWAIHSGQFDDLETPAIRILFDDRPAVLPPAAAGDAAPPEQPVPVHKQATST